MHVRLLEHTPNPEKTIALAARLCYSASGIDDLDTNLDAAKVRELLEKLTSIGHATPFEHASFTFAIEGISRAATHQLVRHRLASYSQQSQRYVEFKNADFVVPPQISADPAALEKFNAHMQASVELYNQLIESGFDKEDARYALPGASVSKIIVTMNTRELHHFFRLRCCNRAQWEIRGVAIEMLLLARGVSPLLFDSAGPACLAGKCPEKSFSCGKSREVRQFFRDLG